VQIKLFLRGLADLLARLLRRPPVRVAVVGEPGSTALMTAPDAVPGYRLMEPPGFDKMVAARIALHVGFYRPGRAAARVHCPMLVCVCENDSVAPASAARRAGARAPHADVYNYPIGHFDIYFDEPFEHAVADQAEFLRGHLLHHGEHSS
jgi:pimeloyl-ACP methyl ester carboxylesterase